MLKRVQGLKDQQNKLETKVDELTTKVEEIAEVSGTHKEERKCTQQKS